MSKFRKKPVVIDAIQWKGDNMYDIQAFCEASDNFGFLPNDKVAITTLEGTMTADKTDWIIRGIKGEFYPCKNEIFLQTYEPIESYYKNPNIAEGTKNEELVN